MGFLHVSIAHRTKILPLYLCLYMNLAIATSLDRKQKRDSVGFKVFVCIFRITSGIRNYRDIKQKMLRTFITLLFISEVLKMTDFLPIRRQNRR